VARVIDNVSMTTLEGFIRETVSTKVSLLCMDNFSGYHRLHWKHRFPHETINHTDGQHVRQGVVGAVPRAALETLVWKWILF